MTITMKIVCLKDGELYSMIMVTMRTNRMMMMTIDVSWLQMGSVTAVEVAKATRSPN